MTSPTNVTDVSAYLLQPYVGKGEVFPVSYISKDTSIIDFHRLDSVSRMTRTFWEVLMGVKKKGWLDNVVSYKKLCVYF